MIFVVQRGLLLAHVSKGLTFRMFHASFVAFPTSLFSHLVSLPLSPSSVSTPLVSSFTPPCPFLALSGSGPDPRSIPPVRARPAPEQQLVRKGEEGECVRPPLCLSDSLCLSVSLTNRIMLVVLEILWLLGDFFDKKTEYSICGYTQTNPDMRVHSCLYLTGCCSMFGASCVDVVGILPSVGRLAVGRWRWRISDPCGAALLSGRELRVVVNTNDPDYEHVYSIEAYDDPMDELLYFTPSANQSDGTVCFMLCPMSACSEVALSSTLSCLSTSWATAAHSRQNMRQSSRLRNTLMSLFNSMMLLTSQWP